MGYGPVENLGMHSLREALSEIYFGDAEEEHIKYIIPLTGNWMVPSSNPDEPVSTWIGYQITTITPKASRIERGSWIYKYCEVGIRLWSLGEQAESAITQVIFWDDRSDVQRVFEKHLGKLIQANRKVQSTIYSQEGFNSELTWLTDLKIMCYIGLDTQAEKIEGFRFIGNPKLRNLPNFKED